MVTIGRPMHKNKAAPLDRALLIRHVPQMAPVLLRDLKSLTPMAGLAAVTDRMGVERFLAPEENDLRS